ncbi:hypothetical protein D3C72_1907510 [compost metagenome]
MGSIHDKHVAKRAEQAVSRQHQPLFAARHDEGRHHGDAADGKTAQYTGPIQRDVLFRRTHGAEDDDAERAAEAADDGAEMADAQFTEARP